ncbi:apolipoprotein F [Zonotrichia leucophrys gambelii]|uniref:apolipoprotein F n=1 Tax=Zonotrichia leucophrys gambelii TaxID=257770 RepID=UPI0031401067
MGFLQIAFCSAATMPCILLFLPLLILSHAMAASIITPALADGDRALLAELAALAEPVPPRAPCQSLHPHRLPGFSRLPALPRGLARAALTLALLKAGCAPQAEAETMELARDVGTTTAAALLRGLARVPGAPAPPPPLALLLLRLALSPGGSACADPPVPGTEHNGTEPAPPPSRENREFPPCRGREDEDEDEDARGTVRRHRREDEDARSAVRRHRREDKDEDACSPPGEREAHRVLDWVPGVSIFYNLGTSVYFAFQGCESTASTRALEAAEDLGYAGLAALTGGLGGPVAMGVQLGLQPGLKAGVRALIGYFTSAGEPSPVPTAHSGAVVIV